MVFFDDNSITLVLFSTDQLFGCVHFADVAVFLDYSQALGAVPEDVEHYLEQVVQILYGTRVGYIGIPSIEGRRL